MCGIDTIFVKMTSNFVYFFFRKKSRKLVKPFEIIVIKKALLKAQFVSKDTYLAPVISSSRSTFCKEFVRLV